MDKTNMESILSQTMNNNNTHTSAKPAKKTIAKSSSATKAPKQSAKSTEPSKSSKASALKVTRANTKKPIHNTNTKHTTSKGTQLIHAHDVKSNNKSGHMLYWSTQLDLRLVAQMYALEHVNHLKNFALVANYLFSHRQTVSDIVGNYNDADKKRYHMYYSVYLMQNKPKAEKNYRKYHRVNK